MEEHPAKPRFNPLTQPVTVPWNVPVTKSDHDKLLAGYIPQMMEDRWVVYATPPCAQNKNTTIHICRSWTSVEQIRLVLAPKKANSEGEEWGKIGEISWETKEGHTWIMGENGDGEDTERQAKGWALGMCRGLCGCELDGADERMEERSERVEE